MYPYTRGYLTYQGDMAFGDTMWPSFVVEILTQSIQFVQLILITQGPSPISSLTCLWRGHLLNVLTVLINYVQDDSDLGQI